MEAIGTQAGNTVTASLLLYTCVVGYKMELKRNDSVKMFHDLSPSPDMRMTRLRKVALPVTCFMLVSCKSHFSTLKMEAI
jgi:hypothetical protein